MTMDANELSVLADAVASMSRMIDALQSIRKHVANDPSALGVAIKATCDNALSDAPQADAQPAPAAPQAEPKREPLSDERIDAALQTDPVLIARLMIGSMTVSEFRAALRRLARIVERAHGIGGSDAE